MSSSRFRRSRFGPLLLFFVFGPSSWATAATPRDELLRLVPADVGFCLVVQDLRSRSATFLSSAFARQLRESALGQALTKAPEVRRLVEFEKALQVQLGVDALQLRDEILGDAVVMAYRPGPPGKPEHEQGMILLRARDGRLLTDLVQRLNRVQKESGEVKDIQAREHNGRTYYRRVGNKGDIYYYLNSSIFVLSPQEALIREVLDLDRTNPAGAEPAVARQLRLLGVARPFVSLWVNPRAFTPEIEWKISQAGAAQAAALQHFLNCWQALEGVALSADVGKEVELVLSLRARTGELPAAARELFAESSRPASLWTRFPDSALLAMAGRFNAGALLALLDGFLTPTTRQTLHDTLNRNVGALLGRNGIREVLDHVGPEWGLCLLAPPADDQGWFPHAVLALQVRPGDGVPPFDQALLAAVHSCALLAVVGYNRRHEDQLMLKTARQDNIEIRYLSGDQAFPPGVRPAFALQGGYLVLGSSPEALRRLGAAPATRPAEEGRDERASELPVLRVSLKDWRRFLTERYEPLIAASAENNRIPREEARRAIDGLLAILQLVNRLELSQRSEPGLLTLTLRLEPAYSLQK